MRIKNSSSRERRFFVVDDVCLLYSYECTSMQFMGSDAPPDEVASSFRAIKSQS
jgi:hypothetical protein